MANVLYMYHYDSSMYVVDDNNGSLEIVLLAVHDPSLNLTEEETDKDNFNKDFNYTRDPEFKSGKCTNL